MINFSNLNNFLGGRLSHLIWMYLFLSCLVIRVFFLDGYYGIYVFGLEYNLVEILFMFLEIVLYVMVWLFLFQWWKGLIWLMKVYILLFFCYLSIRGWVDWLSVESYVNHLGPWTYEVIRKYSDYELHLIAYECKEYGVWGEQYFRDLSTNGSLEAIIAVCDGSKEVLLSKLRSGYYVYSTTMFVHEAGLTGCAIFFGAYVAFVLVPSYFF